MGAGDALLARYQAEIEERSKFIDGIVEGAEKDERDLTEQEMTLLARTSDRIGELNEQVAAACIRRSQIATSSRRADRRDRAAVRRGARPHRAPRPRSSTGPPASTRSTIGGWARCGGRDRTARPVQPRRGAPDHRG